MPKVLEQIAVWMLGVTQWNAIILLPSKENATTLREQLNVTQGFEDMAIQEGMYAFFHQSLGPHKFLQYDSNKLYFRVVGEVVVHHVFPKGV